MLSFKLFLENDEVNNCIFTNLVALFKKELANTVSKKETSTMIKSDILSRINRFNFPTGKKIETGRNDILINKILEELVGGILLLSERRIFSDLIKILLIAKKGMNVNTRIYPNKTFAKSGPDYESAQAIYAFVQGMPSEIGNKIVAVLVDCTPQTDNVDWRPNETTPEDYYAL